MLITVIFEEAPPIRNTLEVKRSLKKPKKSNGVKSSLKRPKEVRRS